MQYLLHYFYEIKTTSDLLTYQEIASWQTLTKTPLNHFELTAIRLLDAEFTNHLND